MIDGTPYVQDLVVYSIEIGALVVFALAVWLIRRRKTAEPRRRKHYSEGREEYEHDIWLSTDEAKRVSDRNAEQWDKR